MNNIDETFRQFCSNCNNLLDDFPIEGELRMRTSTLCVSCEDMALAAELSDEEENVPNHVQNEMEEGDGEGEGEEEADVDMPLDGINVLNISGDSNGFDFIISSDFQELSGNDFDNESDFDYDLSIPSDYQEPSGNVFDDDSSDIDVIVDDVDESDFMLTDAETDSELFSEPILVMPVHEPMLEPMLEPMFAPMFEPIPAPMFAPMPDPIAQGLLPPPLLFIDLSPLCVDWTLIQSILVLYERRFQELVKIWTAVKEIMMVLLSPMTDSQIADLEHDLELALTEEIVEELTEIAGFYNFLAFNTDFPVD